MDDRLVTIATFEFPNQAELARLHLRENDIESYLADMQTTAMDWLIGNAIGYIKLQVAESQAAKAQAILEKFQPPKRKAVSEDDDEPEQIRCLACDTVMLESDTMCRACGWSYEGDLPLARDDSSGDERAN